MPTSRPLRIAVADQEDRMREWYARVLAELGHEVVVSAFDGQDFVVLCLAARPSLLVVDAQMPRLGGLEAAAAISRDQPVPVIVVSALNDPALFDRAAKQHVSAYLVKPIKKADLEAAIAIAMGRFEEFKALRHEASDLRGALEDRKVIERAKGILMQKIGLDEEAAFRELQRIAAESNRRLAEIALEVLTAHQTVGRRRP